MLNSDALVLITEIDKAIASGKFKPTIKEKTFILNLGSQVRTPQKITPAQSKWLEAIYRASQGYGYYGKKEVWKR